MKTILIILLMHFIADFIFQTDEMALNKSKSNYWLSLHVLVYSLVFLLCGVVYFWGQVILVLLWVLFNAALHWMTDFCTSRLTSYLWKKEQRHYFFVAIGFDQMVHYTCLLLTYDWIFTHP